MCSSPTLQLRLGAHLGGAFQTAFTFYNGAATVRCSLQLQAFQKKLLCTLSDSHPCCPCVHSTQPQHGILQGSTWCRRHWCPRQAQRLRLRRTCPPCWLPAQCSLSWRAGRQPPPCAPPCRKSVAIFPSVLRLSEGFTSRMLQSQHAFTVLIQECCPLWQKLCAVQLLQKKYGCVLVDGAHFRPG